MREPMMIAMMTGHLRQGVSNAAAEGRGRGRGKASLAVHLLHTIVPAGEGGLDIIHVVADASGPDQAV
jgi:hypothetical protein